jgi:hypothetical protein
LDEFCALFVPLDMIGPFSMPIHPHCPLARFNPSPTPITSARSFQFPIKGASAIINPLTSTHACSGSTDRRT